MTSKTNNYEDLNYDCNYNLFLAKSLLPNLEENTAKQRAMRWMKKLIRSNRSLEEMKLRNDFLYYLVLNINCGKLERPFDQDPPIGPLTAIAQLLPGGAKIKETTYSDQQPSSSFPSFGTTKSKSGRPMVDQSSPDGGAFLSSQPIPRCGAFCYLTVISKPNPVRQDDWSKI